MRRTLWTILFEHFSQLDGANEMLAWKGYSPVLVVGRAPQHIAQGSLQQHLHLGAGTCSCSGQMQPC